MFMFVFCCCFPWCHLLVFLFCSLLAASFDNWLSENTGICQNNRISLCTGASYSLAWGCYDWLRQNIVFFFVFKKYYHLYYYIDLVYIGIRDSHKILWHLLLWNGTLYSCCCHSSQHVIKARPETIMSHKLDTITLGEPITSHCQPPVVLFVNVLLW